jgi:hypothetical protein
MQTLAYSSIVTQDGRTRIVEPGQFAIVDTTRPLQLTFDHPFSLLCIAILRDVLRSCISALRATVRTTRAPAPHILQPSTMRGLWQQGEAVDGTAANRAVLVCVTSFGYAKLGSNASLSVGDDPRQCACGCEGNNPALSG